MFAVHQGRRARFGATLLLAGAVFMSTSCGDIGAQGGKSKFAEDRDAPATPFDGDRAMGYLKALCDLGPRLSGSEGMAKQQELLQKHFEKLGAKVSFQKFEGRQPSRREAVRLANMIISWQPEAKRRVLLCGHYDTRPIAHEDARRNWDKPFLSANDGTSTVALLMELGHHMKDLKTQVGVDFILFDAEEYIFEPKDDKFFLGSEYFGKEYKKNPPGHKYVAGVLYDIFAHKGAEYKVEMNSKFAAGLLVEDFWAVARAEGVKAFVLEDGYEVSDDHLALNRAGIPCIDIIDMNYPHWHKISDTPDRCHPDSFKNVGRATLAWLVKVK